MIEEWKDIIGYEGLYQISNKGRVKSLGNKFKRKEKILSLNQNPEGYVNVGLHKNGINKKYSVHRLVANAFINNPYNKKQVNHINGIKNDNSINNLEWCTNKENMEHCVKKGLRNRYAKKIQAIKKELQMISKKCMDNNIKKELDNILVLIDTK